MINNNKTDIEKSEKQIDANSANNKEKIYLSKEYYVNAAIENFRTTSRTAHGVIDVSASPDKSSKMNQSLMPEAIAKLAESNFIKVIDYAYNHRDDSFVEPEKLREFVDYMAKQINTGILKNDKLIREGDDSLKYPYTKIKDLFGAMIEFYKEFVIKLNDPKNNPIELAAWVEYRIDLTDHFFGDGCGKVAKAVGAWTLMKNNHNLPKYRSRKELYDYAPKQIRGINKQIEIDQYQKWLNYYKTLFS